MNDQRSTGPPTRGSGGWVRRNWKRVAVGAVVLFVLASVARSVLPALGMNTGSGGGSSGEEQGTSTNSAPPKSKGKVNGRQVPEPGKPLILLNPGLIRPGGNVSVSGTGFDAGAKVDITLGSGKAAGVRKVATTTATKDGSITASFAFPRAVPGNGAQQVTAKQRHGNKSGTANAMMAQGSGTATVSPVAGRPGSKVSLSATGFDANEPLAVYWGRATGPPAVTLKADESGSVSKVPIPVGVGATGVTSLFVMGTKSGAAASAPFQMLGLYPSVSVKPYAIKATQSVNLTGQGFAPGERVFIWMNSATGPPLMAATTDERGAFANAGFTVPYELKGAQSLVLVGEQSRTSVKTGFTILPYQPMARASTYGALPGTSLSFYVQGYAPNEAVHVYLGRGKGGGGNLVSAFRVDGKGKASAAGSYTVPGDAGNAVSITMVGARSGASADAVVKVDKSGGPVDVPAPPPYHLPKNLEK